MEKYYPKNLKAEKISRDFFEKNNSIGINVSKEELKNKIDSNIEKKEEISTADKIKNYKEELTQQGKSQTEILNLLIAKFENEEAVSVWVENWRNFQKLHHFAENKPPAERRAIQNIIGNADFTSENAFSTSLAEISQSAEISQETKLEISQEFNGANVFSVDDLNAGLKQQKTRKVAIENAISTKSREKNQLDLEIEQLENELEKLPLDDPKREELATKIEQKKEVLENTETQIKDLEKTTPKDVSFPLREGFSAKLNDDGSRSIKINSQNFAIKIPSNRLPFTTTKNLRAINLAFPYTILKELHIADTIFSPNLENNTVPSKSQRDMGHLILSSLGIDDTQILSTENIKKLKKDLSFLQPQNGKTGKENLIELGVYDVGSRSLDKEKFREILKRIRENRGLGDGFFEKLNELSYKPK